MLHSQVLVKKLVTRAFRQNCSRSYRHERQSPQIGRIHIKRHRF